MVNFTRDPSSRLGIRQVERGSIRVADENITENIVLTHEAILRDWFPADIESLTQEDLDKILELEPDIVIIGTGRTPRRPPNEFVFALARHGIGLETMDTSAACRTFNILLAEDRRIVALLVLD